MEQKTCVPVGCYENVMIIDERSPLEPESGHQLKYYAPGVGTVGSVSSTIRKAKRSSWPEASSAEPRGLGEDSSGSAGAGEGRVQAQQAVWPNSTHGSGAWRHRVGALQPPARAGPLMEECGDLCS